MADKYTDKIKALKKELKTYSTKDDQRLKAIKDKQKISKLKKQIRARKYAGVVYAGKQAGRNIKGAYKGAKKGFISIDKSLSKFVGKNPLVNGKEQNLKELLKTMQQ